MSTTPHYFMPYAGSQHRGCVKCPYPREHEIHLPHDATVLVGGYVVHAPNGLASLTMPC